MIGMAGPALDDYIFEVLLRDLVGHDHAPSAFLIYLKLWHACGGPGRKGAALSLKTLADDTGLSKSSVQAAVRHLKRRLLISSQQNSPTAIPVYKVHAPWRR
jgi:DNA-binding MarR family transcriptional regulator